MHAEIHAPFKQELRGGLKSWSYFYFEFSSFFIFCWTVWKGFNSGKVFSPKSNSSIPKNVFLVLLWGISSRNHYRIFYAGSWGLYIVFSLINVLLKCFIFLKHVISTQPHSVYLEEPINVVTTTDYPSTIITHQHTVTDMGSTGFSSTDSYSYWCSIHIFFKSSVNNVKV